MREGLAGLGIAVIADIRFDQDVADEIMDNNANSP